MKTKLEQVWVFENGRYVGQFWRAVSSENSESTQESEEITAKAS